MLDRLTIRPAGALRISGRSVCVSATTAKKLVSNVVRRSSADTVGVVLNAPRRDRRSLNMTPALLTRMSSLP